ncbi:holin [Chania multitudinisentens RB-25]|uniref:Holin n=1 Tax=Chania multitudinisentens RB-25 TaxID=1441930 RepID=W0LAE1_9GAMM|nr:phage holin, lambda family [Chania multitudinisentens]AHG18935.1 holin [Chania multitudinisentens RB-25]
MSSLKSDVISLIIPRACEYIQPLIHAILAGVMALLNGAYRNMKIRKCLLNACICALLAVTVRDLLSLIGVKLQWANIASVLIGFLGIDYLSDLIKKLINKKVGLKNDK